MDGSNSMLSPPASASIPRGSKRNTSAMLPSPRNHPLKPGSVKEIALINYVDEKILRINRRYAKKFSNARTDHDDTMGYTTMDEVIDDIDPVIDIVWVSGTPSVQTPYLLALAGIACSYMPAFQFTIGIFRLFKKLDLAFSLLLTLSNNLNNVSHVVSITEKVRIKSLIEETRVAAIQSASASGYNHQFQDFSDSEEIDTDDEIDRINRPDVQDNAMNLSKIYKSSLEILGDSLTVENAPDTSVAENPTGLNV